MVDRKQIIENITSYLTDVIEVPRKEFSGFATCPFAKAERVRGKLLIDVFDPEELDFVQVVGKMITNGYESGLMALFQGNAPVEISSKDTRKFQVFLNKVLRLASMEEYATICFNPNDCVEVEGFNPRAKCPYFLINIAKREVLNNAHKSLTKTKYFDKLSKEYKKYLKVTI